MHCQVSFFSSSPELSNKQRFEFFTRTIPSDHHQVEAMVQIIKKLKWSYISILYEESTYGKKVSCFCSNVWWVRNYNVEIEWVPSTYGAFDWIIIPIRLGSSWGHFDALPEGNLDVKYQALDVFIHCVQYYYNFSSIHRRRLRILSYFIHR